MAVNKDILQRGSIVEIREGPRRGHRGIVVRVDPPTRGGAPAYASIDDFNGKFLDYVDAEDPDTLKVIRRSVSKAFLVRNSSDQYWQFDGGWGGKDDALSSTDRSSAQRVASAHGGQVVEDVNPGFKSVDKARGNYQVTMNGKVVDEHSHDTSKDGEPIWGAVNPDGVPMGPRNATFNEAYSYVQRMRRQTSGGDMERFRRSLPKSKRLQITVPTGITKSFTLNESGLFPRGEVPPLVEEQIAREVEAGVEFGGTHHNGAYSWVRTG